MSHPQTSAVRYSRLVNQSPIFYGWIILLIGTFGAIMTTPGQTHAVSIFIEYFITDLGISRSLVSSLYTVGTLVGSFALPIVGRRIDRHGPRRVMLIITLLFGLACIYMGFVGNVIMLGLGFILIRMLGQGSLGLVSSNIINQWWVRRRGTVMGISGLLMSLIGVGAIPSLLNWLIPIYGWRAMYMLMGLVLLIGLAPLVILFVRDQPEQYGLHPDGDRASMTSITNTTVQNEISWTVQEAQRTLAFWIMGLGLATVALLITGLMFHMVSIFKDNQLDATTAAWVYVPIAATTATVNLGSGILADRIPVRILLAIALFLQTIALFMAQYLTGPTMAFTYGVVLGSTMGLMGTVNSVGWAKYFGRTHLGSITGMAATILIIGSSLGPMPFGVARDWFGSYQLVLTIFALLPFSLAIASLFVGQPQKQA
ncbi:MAG: MFS transporter [Chloroflexi bacterium AL-W]|nr:MFS transporter [Chloroflexi bacterium AL-N1]NOK66811.1 MFS transporter [Chloroflexi bacterium AL-N10]NOK74897.1 MFS transporter [Chloroflexi bacterium AL-N5]NOK81414.1 MFS transporter [Chloroflexi bacterium AL-W]NOK88883.1 MFS transporter [Chloroflexi bacterium AL-N15]